MDDKQKLIGTLTEMGFSKPNIEKAILENKDANVETLMEWLLTHAGVDDCQNQNDASVADVNNPISKDGKMTVETSESSEGATSNENEKLSDGNEEPQSTDVKCLVCNECQKKFKSSSEVEYHAVKSGHQSFSESTEELKPLTQEEIAERAKQLEEKIKLRRREKEEKEKAEAISKEKIRRKTGQEMAMSKQKMKEAEMKQVAEERRREKMEERLARQRVKEQIAKDHQARKEKFSSNAASQSTLVGVSEEKPPVAAQVPPKREYDQCRLQIRLTNGKALSQNFGAKEPLSAVRLYVDMHRDDGSDSFSLMTSFPKKVFTDEDMEKPLSELGLVPSAVLILTKSQA